jgi:eukaryotic-like serine/threonine-protein kinase
MQMHPNDWERAKELFEAALELEPSERVSFLAASCHEASVQRQVEKLLTDYEEAGSFLDNPAFSTKIPDAMGHGEIQIEEVFRPFPPSDEHHATAKSTEIEDPMVGRRLGAYKLVRRVGRGGMAAVFLAVRADDEYQKQVAVKLVQVGLDSQDVLNRFRNERQTLAGLDHPNIVRLLDGGSAPEGLPFLVMEYVEGSPIDEYCDQHKLSVDDRLRLFGKVCDAVQFAHGKMVIHRDLKPSNILVMADGTPKLLDFGIAKVLDAEPSTHGWLATQTGLRCMTPAYASPEQTLGKSITSQSDVYSLGVVLYELLTGHRPYRLTQHSPAEIERAICEQEPETPSTAISRVETDTSPDGKTFTKTPELVSLTREGQPDKLRRRLRGDVDNIVLKALQKEPQQRYGSVAEFSQDIGRHLQHLPVNARPSTLAYRVSKFAQRHKTEVGATVAVLVVIAAAASFAFNAIRFRERLARNYSRIKIQSLAVIPLLNISGDPGQEYFSDGMTDALITDLAQIGSLKVISRTSSARYKQTKKSLPEIARELKVDGVIEGTVQRSGDRVRITAQLIQAASDKHIWANSYERDSRDVLTLEREVASDIARQIQSRLAAREEAPIGSSQPANVKALEAYLQGNYHLNRWGKGKGDEAKRAAAEYFQQSIDSDRNFAPAYVGLARAHWSMLWPSRQDGETVATAAERALALDPNSSDAHEILGETKWRAWKFASAEDEYRRAIQLNPSNAEAHHKLGWVLEEIGKWDDGWKEQQIAQELDPGTDYLPYALDDRRQIDRAIAFHEILVKRSPDDGNEHVQLMRDYLQKGMYNEATLHAERLWTLFGFSQVATEVHRAFLVSGYRGTLRESAKAMEHLMATDQFFLPVNIAECYAALGDKDRAFYWLEQSYAQHDVGMVSTDLGLEMLNAEFFFDPLRSDARFKDLLRRVGLPELQLNIAIASSQQNGPN